ncbi:hypothetical protein HUG10_20250 (plasmid) [Halorarum halophilum]|uniref:DUF8074 domain-containing protein n=1 Tax=Halorarum halophilum TaxID=2743090 RepID=A0A7D5KIE0_9EURY|nr:hypothetical protein [Halobaculum halophilum]QLG29936.1 hypothetical protein HUG10_20250 [Halobaculum halophilum]
MHLSRADVMMYLYNLAVVLTGANVVLTFGIDGPKAMIVVLLGLAFVWFLYFHYDMVD